MDSWRQSCELTEDHAKHFVQDPKADLEAMFEIARQVFEEKARIGKSAGVKWIL